MCIKPGDWSGDGNGSTEGFSRLVLLNMDLWFHNCRGSFEELLKLQEQEINFVLCVFYCTKQENLLFRLPLLLLMPMSLRLGLKSTEYPD